VLVGIVPDFCDGTVDDVEDLDAGDGVGGAVVTCDVALVDDADILSVDDRVQQGEDEVLHFGAQGLDPLPGLSAAQHGGSADFVTHHRLGHQLVGEVVAPTVVELEVVELHHLSG
jgi:hypothetical protein